MGVGCVNTFPVEHASPKVLELLEPRLLTGVIVLREMSLLNDRESSVQSSLGQHVHTFPP